MTLHVGIAACSAEGAALCYRTICVEGARLLGAHAHPEVSMHTPPLADYVAALERDDWPAVGALMLRSARKLASIGADFVVCPDNTIHRALPGIAAQSPLPWIHIADVVADEAAARGFGRVAVLGTRWLVDGPVYEERLAARGLAIARPRADERDEVHRIIMEELVDGRRLPASVHYLRRVVDRLRGEGSDAVALACTELPLVLDDATSPLPVLDSTRLLARAALRRAVGRAAPTG